MRKSDSFQDRERFPDMERAVASLLDGENEKEGLGLENENTIDKIE